MLQFMRDRASSWMIKTVLAIIVLAFMFMGVGNFGRKANNVAATVNGEPISVRQFYDSYYKMLDMYRQQFGGALTDEMLERMNLKEKTLAQLITKTLILQKADDLGLVVSDDELAKSISHMQVFQKDGAFDNERYSRLLKHNRMTPETFEAELRQELIVNKLQDFITNSVKVSEAEAAEWYNWENSRVKIKAVCFEPDAYQDITPAQSELDAFFAEHQENYKTPEKAAIVYMLFDPADYMADVTIDPADVQADYDANITTYEVPKTVEARHILIKVDQNAPADLVAQKKQEILKIYQMVHPASGAGKDFAAAAREFSEGPSAKNGGQLGAFKKEDMVAPFAEKAFSMNAGEISEPVRTQFGWHIIKVEKINEASVRSFEQVKSDIEKKLARQKAKDLAYNAALAAFDVALDENSVEKAGAALEHKAITSPLFTRDGRLETVAGGRELVRQAFDLYEGDISDVVELSGRFCVFQVAQRLPAAVPALKDVSDQVEADLLEELRDEKAAEEAAAFLDSIMSADDSIDAAAEAAGLEMITTDFFGRRESIPSIGREPTISRAAFLLNRESPCANEVLHGKKGYYVVCLEDRELPDQDAFAEKKDTTMARLLKQKQEDVFAAWVSSLTAASEITRDPNLIDE